MRWAHRCFARSTKAQPSLYPSFKSRVLQSLEFFPEPNHENETFEHFSYEDYKEGRLNILEVADKCLAEHPSAQSQGFEVSPFIVLKLRQQVKEHAAELRVQEEWTELTRGEALGSEKLEEQAFQGYVYRKAMKEIWGDEWLDHPNEQAADKRITTHTVAFTPQFLQQLDLESEKKYYDYMVRMGSEALSRPNNRILPMKQLAVALRGLPPSVRDRSSGRLVSQTQMHYFLNKLYFTLAPPKVRQNVFSRFSEDVAYKHRHFSQLLQEETCTLIEGGQPSAGNGDEN